MNAYSFLDVHAAISGPGGNLPLASEEAGAAEEGITIEPVGDKSTMTEGADGSWMHSLHASKAGRVTVRLLKVSGVNARLQAMYDFQTDSAARHGRNTITIRDTTRGDVVTCAGCAFAAPPTLSYGKTAGTVDWTFHAGRIDRTLGSGTPER